MIGIQQAQGHSVAPTPLIVQNDWDYEETFTKAMSQAGIDFRDKIIADGALHRFPTGKKGHKDGWYVFYGMAGAFGDWSRDVNEKWCLRNKDVPGLDKEQLFEQIEKAKKNCRRRKTPQA